MAPIKVAAVQAAPHAFDLEKSLDKLAALTADAAKQGAKLVVFAEAFLTGYPRHLGFKIGSRSEEDREWYTKYVTSSVIVPEGIEGKEWLSSYAADGSQTEFEAFARICKVAVDNKVHLSLGIVERSIIGSTLFCTLILISPEGILLSKHRKLQPTAAERVVWSQGEATNPGGGDNLPVVKTPIGAIGGLICWENYMPLARYALYKKGVEIYTAPTADARSTWLPTMQHVAQEGRCFVISVNQFQTPSGFPNDYPPSVFQTEAEAAGAPEEEKKAWSRGGSCIISPLGQVLAGPLWDKEGILLAEIDVSSLTGAKLDFDPIGHYAREGVMMEVLDGLKSQ